MENQAQAAPNGSKSTMWILILVVVIIVAGGAYYFLSQDDGTNTNSTNNANAVVNSVSNANENANTALNANTNESSNINIDSQTNTNEANINGSTNSPVTTNTNPQEQGYTDDEVGFTFAYPSDWKVSEYPNGTISVVPSVFQEPAPVLKALSSGLEDAVTWIESNWLSAPEGTLQATGQSQSFSNVTGELYEIDGKPYAVFIDAGDYTLVVSMNVLSDTTPFATYKSEYRALLDSLSL